MPAFEHLINLIAQPYWLLPMALLGLVLMLLLYRWWTRPAAAVALLGLLILFYVVSLTNPNFRAIVAKPDNVPITILVLCVSFFLWVALRNAARNDTRVETGQPLFEAGRDDKVLVWPDLVYTELICLIFVSAALVIWAILAKAPLEQAANPGYAPNPAKAPWYFLGLQEMLVYFDPWMAGVVYPGLIVVGLIALPYLDPNPRGAGYYTLKQRPFAITTWLFGFLILWVMLIFVGTFLRGPNWNFYGPYEYWNPNKQALLTNINLSDLYWNNLRHEVLPTAEANPTSSLPIWLLREWPGFALVAAYFFLTPLVLRFTLFRRLYREMGATRYLIMMTLLLFMGLMPIKMVLRWLFNLKYFIYLPEFGASL